ncbi:MAG: NRDE family protein [Betaproteobacteria bacterium]|nr:NRDE family protein [Betaproteobacteria bacterium]
MCLILLAWRAHPQYPLIFAGNRDEHYERPSAPADFWPGEPNIFGGRDLEHGGTWLGLTRAGRFAAVTNYRDGPAARPAPRSRGSLTADFLRRDDEPRRHLAEIVPDAAQYRGFTLLIGNLDRLYSFSNRGSGIDELAPGVHGLSNHLLDTPWPKVARGKERLTVLLQAGETDLIQGLFGALADRHVAPDSELPDTGVGLERERALSPAFVAGDRYGTRASTVLLVNKRNEVVFLERGFGVQGAPLGERARRFAFHVRARGRVTKAAGQDV